MRRQSGACPEPSRRDSETKRSSEERFFNLGVIVKPHGVRGELRVRISLRDVPLMEEVQIVYLGPALNPHTLKSVRLHQGNFFMKLVGCDSRLMADEMRGMEVRIASEDMSPLGSDEYYVHELVGLSVVDEQGEGLGELVEVIVTGANDVYRVVGQQGEILVPAIKDVVRSVDMEAGEISVRLLPGLR